MSDQKQLDRRGFLKGSALYAAAAGLAMARPVAAQEQAPADKKPEEPKQDEPAEKTPDEKKKNALVDKDGREYRVCDMCGGNMYLEGNTWTCDQCGFSYEV
jgi:anaerobic selenocysteine-containing dehydrogenase